MKKWTLRGPAVLFCPASRPDRFQKAAHAADAVVLDLEDGVGYEDKHSARAAIQRNVLDPDRTVVRINASGTADQALDLEALHNTPYRTVMLPKASSPADIEALSQFQVIALCETAKGAMSAAAIAVHPTTVALMWGGEDLIASIGGYSSRHLGGRYRDVARQVRSTVLLAAATYGIPAIDAVFLDMADQAGLREEALDAAASGFGGSACIHPSQVAVVREAYLPGMKELKWAQRVLAMAAGQGGAFSFEGRMIDGPILRQAREILTRRLDDPLTRGEGCC